jgi:DNA (cytosine-5)-methyltransferase 1
MLKMLDCFCGMGGVSDGFASEGFDVTGIDIVNAPEMLGYKHKFLQADFKTLNGAEFKGYDVIWGSPPCRDFSQIGVLYGKKWKNPPDQEKGMATIRTFLKFVDAAQPKYWIMENVALLKKYFKDLEPRAESYITYGKRHVFYGNFPLFLIPRDMRVKVRELSVNGRDKPVGDRKTTSWLSAKIPFPVSTAFACACRDALESIIIVCNSQQSKEEKP